jgi:hypothetical protein
VGVAVLLGATLAHRTFGQEAIQSREMPSTALKKMKPTMHASTTTLKKNGASSNDGISMAPSSSGVSGIDSIVNWTDAFAYPGFDSNGNPQLIWPYTMVGNPPESGQTAYIRAPIVPVTVELLDSKGKVALTFGPDDKVLDAAEQSPEFVPYTFTNGTGQFNDQLMRASFANRLYPNAEGSEWHTILYPKVQKARTMKVPFLTSTGSPAWYVFVNAEGQPVLAAIDYDTFNNRFSPPSPPADNSTPVGAAELEGEITTHDISTFLFNNTVLFLGGNINNCCVIGYHTYDQEPGTKQNGNLPRLYVLNYSSWLSPGLFLFGFEDMTAWSHEMAETFNDPFGNNITPWWLSVDPFTGGGNCQNDLEVGDVVEVLDSLNPVSTFPGKGLTYHPQNMAMFPWFAFTSPSPANLGSYSFPDETTLMTLSPGPLLPGCKVAP